MKFLSGVGMFALGISLLCLPIGLLLLVIALIGNYPRLQKISLRVLLAAGILFLLSITFCSIGGFNI